VGCVTHMPKEPGFKAAVGDDSSKDAVIKSAKWWQLAPNQHGTPVVQAYMGSHWLLENRAGRNNYYTS